MDFDDTPEEAAIRDKVRALRAQVVSAEEEAMVANTGMGQQPMSDAELMKIGRRIMGDLQKLGWSAVPHWPKELGGVGASNLEKNISRREFGPITTYFGPWYVGQNILGMTLIKYLNEPLRSDLLPRHASGELLFCQMFSEPAAGSDLAGITTRAEQQDDGDWIINGQKIWTTQAHNADYGVLITRTDPTVAKHKGLTVFLIDMHDPGVEVRPIRQGSGQSDFNEVYFTDLRIPDIQRMGKINGGWTVALHILGNERLSIGSMMNLGVDNLIELARQLEIDGAPALDNAVVRDKIASWYAREQGLKYTGLRAQSALSQGREPGPENSIGKLVAGTAMQDVHTYAMDLMGMDGMVCDADNVLYSRIQGMYLRSIGTRIEGGTDEILRNIIGERVLGLPEDMRADKGIAFADIPKWKAS